MNLDELKKVRSRAVSQLGNHPYRDLVDKFFRVMEIAPNEAQVSWDAVFFGKGEVYKPSFLGGEFIGEFVNTGNRIGILSGNYAAGFNKYGLLKKESLPSSSDHLVIFNNGNILKMQPASMLVIYSDSTRQTPKVRANAESNLLNGKMREFIANIH